MKPKANRLSFRIQWIVGITFALLNYVFGYSVLLLQSGDWFDQPSTLQETFPEWLYDLFGGTFTPLHYLTESIPLYGNYIK